MLALWLIFFAVGLFPETVYWTARLAGAVVTQNALINSPSLVTLFLAFYLAFFAYQCCLDAGLSRDSAVLRAIQVGILGLIAFLPYPFYLLLAPGNLEQLNDRLQRADEVVAVFGLPVAKLLAWLYLLITVVRHHLTGGGDIFARMYPRFARQNNGGRLETGPDD
jgi:hypothetical protein